MRVTVAFALWGCGASEHPVASERTRVDAPACVPTPTADASSIDSFATAILADAGDASVVDAADASPPIDYALSRAAHDLPRVVEAKLPKPSATSILAFESLRSSANHMPPEVILRILKQNTGRWRLCFEAVVNEHPTIRLAELTAFFAIDKTGSVVLAETDPPASSDGFAGCVQRSLLSISYPQPEPATMMAVEFTVRFDAAALPPRHGAAL